MRRLCLLFVLLIALPAAAQRADSSIFGLPIQMDEVVVAAVQNGWDVAGFIRRVRTDTTFYKAFRSLRLAEYTAVNDIRILNLKGGTQASLHSRTRQVRQQDCRTMQVLEETTTGDFYQRHHDYRYYTAELYAYLFFTTGRVCHESDIIAGSLTAQGGGQLEKSKAQLKQLIFNPGSRITGVPLMGNRASIFDPPVADWYTFKLLHVDYNGEDCYLFQAIPKPEHRSEVVFNELSTWFRSSDYAILARTYSLSFHTVLYDFDVRMKVRLQPVGGKLLPASIEYAGNWKVVTKPRERAVFTASFQY